MRYKCNEKNKDSYLKAIRNTNISLKAKGLFEREWFGLSANDVSCIRKCLISPSKDGDR